MGKVRAFHAVMGGVLDPHAAYLVLRGLKVGTILSSLELSATL